MAKRQLNDQNISFTTGVSTSNSIDGVQTSPSTYTGTETPVLWRFNETDTTQVGTRVVPCDLNATPISSETISVVSDATTVGTRLSFALTFSTSSSSTNAGLWPILQGGAPVILPNRFRVKIRFGRMTVTNITTLYFGVGVWTGDTGSTYGVGIAQLQTGNATGVVRLQDSDAATTTRPWRVMSATGAGGTVSAGSNIDYAGTQYEFRFNLKQGSGGNPFLANAFYQSAAGYGLSTQTPFTSVPAARSAAGQAFQTDATTIDAGWNDKTCNRLMLFVIATTAAGTPSCTVEVGDFVVLKDEMDL